MPAVVYKFKGRRKAEDFTLYPRGKDNPNLITFQSDKTIGQVDLETGKGKIYLGKTPGAYFVHLSMAEAMEFPADFVEAVKVKMPPPGSTVSLGGGMVIVQH